jgi:hypothetical protein
MIEVRASGRMNKTPVWLRSKPVRLAVVEVIHELRGARGRNNEVCDKKEKQVLPKQATFHGGNIANKTKKPEKNILRLFNERLAATYSRRTYRTTTIGPAVFDGRVRNGNGSDHCGIATKVLCTTTASCRPQGGQISLTRAKT